MPPGLSKRNPRDRDGTAGTCTAGTGFGLGSCRPVPSSQGAGTSAQTLTRGRTGSVPGSPACKAGASGKRLNTKAWVSLSIKWGWREILPHRAPRGLQSRSPSEESAGTASTQHLCTARVVTDRLLARGPGPAHLEGTHLAAPQGALRGLQAGQGWAPRGHPPPVISALPRMPSAGCGSETPWPRDKATRGATPGHESQLLEHTQQWGRPLLLVSALLVTAS